MTDALFSRTDIIQIVCFARLHLYNRGLPCGASPIRLLMDQLGVRPLPSLTSIKRILSRHHLTQARTGLFL